MSGAAGHARGTRGVPGVVSIVIPTYNEAHALPALLAQLERLGAVEAGCEVVVVDGGSTDGTPGLVRPPCVLVQCGKRGRGSALNAGARASCGEVLLFLHCDSVLPRDAIGELRRVMHSHRAGCFGIRFDRRSPVLWLCQWFSNIRVVCRGLAYGDQGIFIDRSLFFAVGGFPDLPLMEDLQFSENLRERGVRIALARRRIVTSARRFQGGEVRKLRTWLSMVRLRRLYHGGVAAEELARLYRDMR